MPPWGLCSHGSRGGTVRHGIQTGTRPGSGPLRWVRHRVLHPFVLLQRSGNRSMSALRVRFWGSSLVSAVSIWGIPIRDTPAPSTWCLNRIATGIY